MSLTVAEIKNSLSEERRREEKDLWYARYALRPAAAYMAWFLIRLGISGKQTVVIGLLIGVVGCGLVAFGSYSVVLIGCLLLIFSSWLDYVDGTIARATGTVDKEGAYLDLTRDNVIGIAVPIAVGISISMVTWGLLLALFYAWSTLSISDSKRVFGEDDIYRTEGHSLWRLVFLLGTNVQVTYLVILLLAAVTQTLHIYLYTFTLLTGCEIVIVVARRLRHVRVD